MSTNTMELQTPDERGSEGDFFDWDEDLRRTGSALQIPWGAERRSGIREFIRRPVGATSIRGSNIPPNSYMSVGPRPMLEINVEIPRQEAS
jgi:hypothetical protein